MYPTSLPIISLIIALFAVGCGEPASVDTSKSEQSNKLINTLNTRETFSLNEVLPTNELRVIAVVDEFALKYQSAKNELQKSAIWKERNKAMILATNSKEEKTPDGKWLGILEKMGTTSDGNAHIVVRIAPNITLATYSSELTDIGEETLIKHGSKDYIALSNIPERSVIRFKYAINPEGIGLTEKEKMIDPTFPTKFSGITHVGKEELHKLAKIVP